MPSNVNRLVIVITVDIDRHFYNQSSLFPPFDRTCPIEIDIIMISLLFSPF